MSLYRLRTIVLCIIFSCCVDVNKLCHRHNPNFCMYLVGCAMLYFKFLSIISKHFVPKRKATLFISWLLLLHRFSFDLITTSFSQDIPRVFMVVVMIQQILLLTVFVIENSLLKPWIPTAMP